MESQTDAIVKWQNVAKSYTEIRNFKKLSLKDILETSGIQTISLN
jgi:hypothetical protein